MSILCDGLLFNHDIDELGNTVIVRKIVNTSLNTRGDATEETSDYTRKAFVNVVSAGSPYNKEGQFIDADLQMFFKPEDESLLVEGNQIKYRNLWYEISKVMIMDRADTVYLIEIWAEKV